MKEIINKIQNNEKIAKNELVNILANNDISINSELFIFANKIRQEAIGDEIYLRALIEFSNVCQKDCFYCGLRRSNKSTYRYNLSIDEILKCVEKAISLDYKTIVLQSGESQSYTQNQLITLIKEIKKYDVALTLSLGEKTYDEYKTYKKAGADRYLLRIETTDKKLYNQFHPNSSLENRVRCLKDLKILGYELGCGCLVGLPNQTIESLTDDILFFEEINADMIGIGAFITHSQTPLAKSKNGDFNLALKVMALTRILMPKINIPATTAMETLQTNGQQIALQSGANVVMVNFTTSDKIGNYNIYPNKNNVNHLDTLKRLGLLNRPIEMSRGNSLKWEEENK